MVKWIARVFYKYGLFGASIPSIHGIFETEVPERLKKSGESSQ